MYLLLNIFLIIFSENSYPKCNTISSGEILIGQSATFTGPSASLGIELWRGAKAYFDHINSQGEVHGRKIVVVAKDDQSIPDQVLKNTIIFLRQSNLFALFGYVGNPTLVKSLPAIQKHTKNKLLLFSNFTGAQSQGSPLYDSIVINVRSSYQQETSKTIDYFVSKGKKKIGLFIQNDSFGRSGAEGVEFQLQKYGFQIIAETNYKRGDEYNVSMKQQVDKLLNAGVDAVISIGQYTASAAFIRDARNFSLNVPIANVLFVGTDALLEIFKKEGPAEGKSYIDDLIVSQVVPPWTDKSFSIAREYKELMTRYHPNQPRKTPSEIAHTLYSFGPLEGFINDKFFVKILEETEKDFSQNHKIQALDRESKFNIGPGDNFSVVLGPLDSQALDAVFLTTIINDQYVYIKE